MDGGFNVYQTCVGDISDWALLNESLSVDEMKNYTACHDLPSHVRPLLHFDSTLSGWELKGTTLSYNLTAEDMCKKRFTDSLVMFLHQMEKEEASEWCQKLGGHLPVPQNHEDNEELSRMGLTYLQECLNTWSSVAWLGLTSNLSTGVWENTIDGSLLKWDKFYTNWRGPAENCLCATIHPHYGAWFCGPCEEKTCVACLFGNTPLLRLRGDCKETGFDHDFFIKGVAGKMPLYVGYYQSRIKFVKDTWRLESTIEGSKSYAEMDDDIATNPLGRHLWRINSDECGQYQVMRLCCAKVECGVAIKTYKRLRGAKDCQNSLQWIYCFTSSILYLMQNISQCRDFLMCTS